MQLNQLPIVTKPSDSVSVGLLTAAEREQILITWNNTADYPIPDRCIHEYIEEQVLKTPNAIALISTDGDGTIHQLTYSELNSKSNQLAHHLRSLGIGSETIETTPIIAVCVERSPEMVIAFLSILKAGAAHLSLDPLEPDQRRAYKLEDSNAVFLLTQDSLFDSVVPENIAIGVLCLDRDWPTIATSPTENLPTLNNAQSLAYVIYTSGSTGNPKGVMILHQGLSNHSFGIRNLFELKPDDRALQFSSMSFDIIIEEIYPTLISGAALVLRSATINSSITQFISFINTHHISILNLPTAFWHELVIGMTTLNLSLAPTLRLVITGGEKASKQLYQQWCERVRPEVRWINSYGPTEATVSATMYEPAAEGFEWDQPEIPIGRPNSNVQIYILDPEHNPVPVGVSGELYIGGAGVGAGYINRPEQTADKFIPNPFSNCINDRLYSTGDIVRYRPDGAIEFVGRQDFQVKIRGFRVELGEIEQALELHPDIQQAIVIAIPGSSGEKNLAAYYILRSALSIDDLRAFIRTQIPDYMVPMFFTSMDVFPLTTNGKVDRAALPQPKNNIKLNTSDFIAPSTPVEVQLVEIWERFLGISNISITDNIFDLGAYSLLILRMMAELEFTFKKALPINILFEAPTIQKLAPILGSSGPIIDRPKAIPFLERGNKAPIFCMPGARNNLLFVHNLIKHWGDRDHPIYGIQEPLKEDSRPLPTTIQSCAAYYIEQIRSVQPEGPYHLVGYSIGGLIAYEIAQQLLAQGHTIALLGLLDPTPAYGAIGLRRLVKKLPNNYAPILALQIGLLKLLTVQDTYSIHLRKVPFYRIPNYLLKEWKTWSQTEEFDRFWQRFLGIIGIADRKSDRSSESNTELNTDEFIETTEMVMKYERAILYYLPKSYKGEIKFFYSEEWDLDQATWQLWKRLSKDDRSVLTGGHRTFYDLNTEIIVQQLIPLN